MTPPSNNNTVEYDEEHDQPMAVRRRWTQVLRGTNHPLGSKALPPGMGLVERFLQPRFTAMRTPRIERVQYLGHPVNEMIDFDFPGQRGRLRGQVYNKREVKNHVTLDKIRNGQDCRSTVSLPVTCIFVYTRSRRSSC